MPKIKKMNSLPENFCAVPFTSLIFNPTGNVGCCREQGHRHSVGNIFKQSFEDIWNGPEIRAWRKEFLTGNIKTCAKHIEKKQCHLSKQHLILDGDFELSEYQSRPPTTISPGYSGQCNLTCHMCQIHTEPRTLYDEHGFHEYAEEHLYPYVKYVEPYAGEPMVQKVTHELMDKMAVINPNAKWNIITNGVWKFTPAVRKRFDNINLRTIHISLDSINSNTYPKVRKNGNLNQVLKTIDDLIQYRNDREAEGKCLKLIVSCLVQKLNWKEVPEFLRYVLDKKCYPFIQYLYSPAEYSLSTLNPEQQIEILNYYFDNMEPYELVYIKRIIYSLAAVLDPETNQKYRKAMTFILGEAK